jgi:fatty acid desaturase
MHDASHYSLFTTKKLNNTIGNILGAYPIFHNVEQYRPYHFQHHLATGTIEDPDLNLVKAYPTKLISLIRKFVRDLIGITGIKTEFGLMAMHLGFLKYNLGNYIEKIPKEERTWKQILTNAYYNLKGPIAINLIMFSTLAIIGKPYLYLLWITAMLTTYNFCLRVRSIAEHSVVEDTNDPYKNTRTTYANFIEKNTFCSIKCELPFRTSFFAKHSKLQHTHHA